VIMATITASSYCFDIHLSSHKWEEYEEQGWIELQLQLL
jgi:hypothetical protein